MSYLRKIGTLAQQLKDISQQIKKIDERLQQHLDFIAKIGYSGIDDLCEELITRRQLLKRQAFDLCFRRGDYTPREREE